MAYSAVIKKDDFDTYAIELPRGSIFGGRRKKFIFSELEKRHPGFSAKHSVDEKLFLKNKKPFASVTVMDSVILSRYKNKFAKKILRTDSSRFNFVFIPTWIKLMPLIFVLCLIWVFAVFNIIKLQSRAKSHVTQNFQPHEQQRDSETEKTISPQISSSQFIDGIIEKIIFSEGAVSSVSWKSEGDAEKFQAEISNCFPEQILPDFVLGNSDLQNAVKFSSVSYVDSMPNFSIHCSLPNYFPTHSQTSSPISSQNILPADVPFVLRDFKTAKLFREKLASAPFVITSEKFGPLELSFTFFPERISSCMEFISQLENSFNIKVSSFSFSNTSEFWNGTVSFVVVSENSHPSTIQKIVPLMERYSKMITKKRKPPQTFSASQFQSQTSTLGQELSHPARRKIGEVKNSDGITRIFYKLDNGKIVMEKK